MNTRMDPNTYIMNTATAMTAIGIREGYCDFSFAILCSRLCAMPNKTKVQIRVTVPMIKSFGYSVLVRNIEPLLKCI